jgi:enoyl-CoA hydratase
MFQIKMNAPGMNALGTELMTWLIDELQRADGQPVLLTGEGRAFSAGLNLKEIASADAAQMQFFLETLEKMVEALFLYPGPTVAAVNGHAIAGGCVLALLCDHRVATTDARARIGLNEVAIGVQFPPVTFAAIAQRIPRASHETVLLGAGLHSPERAVKLGLIDELADDPMAVATERLAALAKGGRGVYAATKLAIRGSIAASAAQQKAFIEEVVPVWTAPELKASLLRHLKG